ncbi:hypothetical protein U8P75_22385 [Rhizobium beringeri]|nr:hypothetical protein U8P75_22385 [Rhizobium beringeri]
MRIYFNNTQTVKGLAKKLVREVRSWGDTIKWMNALTVVARAFGHDEYVDLVKTIGYADPSPSDRSLSTEEASKRYEQYVEAIASNDFTREEAVKIVTHLRLGGWWGFGDRSEASPHRKLLPSKYRMQFRDVSVVQQFYESLRLALKASGYTTPFGTRKLAARLFGFDTYAEFEACAGQGIPTPSDFHVSPEELDRRVEEYLRVLMDADLDADQSTRLLYEVGVGGWWQLERTDIRSDVRQAKFADRIEDNGRPYWRSKRKLRPDGLKKRAKKEAYAMFENNYPHDEVHLWALLPGEEIIGYCDDDLGTFLDKIDLNLRTEVASLYREILMMPDARAEIMIVRDATRGDQRVDELYISNEYHKQFFKNYADFTKQGGRRLFRPSLNTEAGSKLQGVQSDQGLSWPHASGLKSHLTST